MFKRLIATIVCITFIFSNFQYVHAQEFSINQLPVPGSMVGVSVPFLPLALKGLVVNPKKPLEFQFIVDTGSSGVIASAAKQSFKEEANRLVKYFLAGLTIPEGDLWVNLSPYEKDRITTSSLGQTELGRDLLAQDYILKQLTASLIYPEKDLGKEFWSRVYKQAQEKFGTTDIPVNTFNKVWILPDQAQVFENGGAAYVTKSTLKVILDEDYLAMQKHAISPPLDGSLPAGRQGARGGVHKDISPTLTLPTKGEGTSALASQIIRDIVIPEITKEVNQGQNFAPLRQIYDAMILAKWYKETIANGLLDALYTNKKKTAGVNLNDPTVKQQIYERYLQAYKKGVFNYIKEDPFDYAQGKPTPNGQTTPRKYFSGGIPMKINLRRDGAMSAVKSDGAMMALTVDLAQTSKKPQDEAMRVKPPQQRTTTLSTHKRYKEMDEYVSLKLKRGEFGPVNRVIDFGIGASDSGDGFYSPAFFELVDKFRSVLGDKVTVTGIDQSDGVLAGNNERLREFPQYANQVKIRKSGFQIPQNISGKNQTDLIFVRSVLLHYSPDQRQIARGYLADALREGGFFLEGNDLVLVISQKIKGKLVFRELIVLFDMFFDQRIPSSFHDEAWKTMWDGTERQLPRSEELMKIVSVIRFTWDKTRAYAFSYNQLKNIFIKNLRLMGFSSSIGTGVLSVKLDSAMTTLEPNQAQDAAMASSNTILRQSVAAEILRTLLLEDKQGFRSRYNVSNHRLTNPEGIVLWRGNQIIFSEDGKGETGKDVYIAVLKMIEEIALRYPGIGRTQQLTRLLIDEESVQGTKDMYKVKSIGLTLNAKQFAGDIERWLIKQRDAAMGTKQIILQGDQLPKPVGPYSYAVRVGDFVFTSGQGARQPETNKLVEGGIEDHARQVLTNLENVLRASGSSWEQVRELKIFVTDENQLPAIDKICKQFLGTNEPRRTVVKVERLPADNILEIEAVSNTGTVSWDQNGHFVFASALPYDLGGKGISSDIKEQTRQALMNLTIALKALGSSLTDGMKFTVRLRNMDDFKAMNEVYTEFIDPNSPPARTAMQIAELPEGVLVKIEAIAVKSDMAMMADEGQELLIKVIKAGHFEGRNPGRILELLAQVGVVKQEVARSFLEKMQEAPLRLFDEEGSLLTPQRALKLLNETSKLYQVRYQDGSTNYVFIRNTERPVAKPQPVAQGSIPAQPVLGVDAAMGATYDPTRTIQEDQRETAETAILGLNFTQTAIFQIGNFVWNKQAGRWSKRKGVQGGHPAAAASSSTLDFCDTINRRGADPKIRKPHASLNEYAYQRMIGYLSKNRASRLRQSALTTADRTIQGEPRNETERLRKELEAEFPPEAIEGLYELGLQSYPDDPDIFQVKTGSVGLGPARAIAFAFMYQWLKDHGFDVPDQHFRAIEGDGAFWEGNLLEMLPLVKLYNISNFTIVIDNNEQTLDMYRENRTDAMIKNLEANEIRVVHLMWGSKFKEYQDREGADIYSMLRDSLNRGLYHKLLHPNLTAAQIKTVLLKRAREALSEKQLQSKTPAVKFKTQKEKDEWARIWNEQKLQSFFDSFKDDNEFFDLFMDVGGHDPVLVSQAYEEARVRGINGEGPTAIIADTIKGWQLPIRGLMRNHSLPLDSDQFEAFREKMGIPRDDLLMSFEEQLAAKGGNDPKLQKVVEFINTMKQRQQREAVEFEEFRNKNRAKVFGQMKLEDFPTLIAPDILRPSMLGKTKGAIEKSMSPMEAIGTWASYLSGFQGKKPEELKPNEKALPLLASLNPILGPDVMKSTNFPYDHRLYTPQADANWDVVVNDDLGAEVIPAEEAAGVATPQGMAIDPGIIEGAVITLMETMGQSDYMFGVPMFPKGAMYEVFVARGQDMLRNGVISKSTFALIMATAGTVLSGEGRKHKGIDILGSLKEMPDLDIWTLYHGFEAVVALSDHFQRIIKKIYIDYQKGLIKNVGTEVEKVIREFDEKLREIEKFPKSGTYRVSSWLVKWDVWRKYKAQKRFVGKTDVEIEEQWRQDILTGAYNALDYSGTKASEITIKMDDGYILEDYTPGENVIHIFSMGAPTDEVLRAADALLKRGVYVDVTVVTNPTRFYGTIARKNDFKRLDEIIPEHIRDTVPMLAVADASPDTMAGIAAARGIKRFKSLGPNEWSPSFWHPLRSFLNGGISRADIAEDAFTMLLKELGQAKAREVEVPARVLELIHEGSAEQAELEKIAAEVSQIINSKVEGAPNISIARSLEQQAKQLKQDILAYKGPRSGLADYVNNRIISDSFLVAENIEGQVRDLINEALADETSSSGEIDAAMVGKKAREKELSQLRSELASLERQLSEIGLGLTTFRENRKKEQWLNPTTEDAMTSAMKRIDTKIQKVKDKIAQIENFLDKAMLGDEAMPPEVVRIVEEMGRLIGLIKTSIRSMDQLKYNIIEKLQGALNKHFTVKDLLENLSSEELNALGVEKQKEWLQKLVELTQSFLENQGYLLETVMPEQERIIERILLQIDSSPTNLRNAIELLKKFKISQDQKGLAEAVAQFDKNLKAIQGTHDQALERVRILEIAYQTANHIDQQLDELVNTINEAKRNHLDGMGENSPDAAMVGETTQEVKDNAMTGVVNIVALMKLPQKSWGEFLQFLVNKRALRGNEALEKIRELSKEQSNARFFVVDEKKPIKPGDREVTFKSSSKSRVPFKLKTYEEQIQKSGWLIHVTEGGLEFWILLFKPFSERLSSETFSALDIRNKEPESGSKIDERAQILKKLGTVVGKEPVYVVNFDGSLDPNVTSGINAVNLLEGVDPQLRCEYGVYRLPWGERIKVVKLREHQKETEAAVSKPVLKRFIPPMITSYSLPVDRISTYLSNIEGHYYLPPVEGLGQTLVLEGYLKGEKSFNETAKYLKDKIINRTDYSAFPNFKIWLAWFTVALQFNLSLDTVDKLAGYSEQDLKQKKKDIIDSLKYTEYPDLGADIIGYLVSNILYLIPGEGTDHTLKGKLVSTNLIKDLQLSLRVYKVAKAKKDEQGLISVDAVSKDQSVGDLKKDDIFGLFISWKMLRWDGDKFQFRTIDDFDRALDAAMVGTGPGGIDLNQINVNRVGKTIKVEFDPAQLNELLQGGFEGFMPVIINITPIDSPLPLLGIAPRREEESLAKI